MRTNQSFYKGLKLLETIATARHGLKCAELAKVIETPSSNTSIFLNTLIELGYIVKDGRDGLYYLSDKLKELSSEKSHNRLEALKANAESEMKRLHALFDENIILSIMNRHHLSSLVEIPSGKSLRIVNRPEDWFIPHVTAAGKVLLAFSKHKMKQAYLHQVKFPELTESSIKTQEQLLKSLDEVKQAGFADNTGEYDEFIYGISAPIIADGEAIAALVIQYPSFRHETKFYQSMKKEVITSAQKISNLYQ